MGDVHVCLGEFRAEFLGVAFSHEHKFVTLPVKSNPYGFRIFARCGHWGSMPQKKAPDLSAPALGIVTTSRGKLPVFPVDPIEPRPCGGGCPTGVSRPMRGAGFYHTGNLAFRVATCQMLGPADHAEATAAK